MVQSGSGDDPHYYRQYAEFYYSKIDDKARIQGRGGAYYVINKIIEENEEGIEEKLSEAGIEWGVDGEDNMLNKDGFFMRMSKEQLRTFMDAFGIPYLTLK